ncbi:MAG: hypothetical protein KAH22_11925 [Thiotrichaceae bacterium]|nr:hypothetical protein [Thiotrichaceae bacterium]
MKKQLLVLSDAWETTYNEFFEIDPELANENNSNWWHFKEDMLQIEDRSAGLLIDLGWYPEFNAEGAFKLVLVKISEAPDEMPNNWDNPLKIFYSNNRSEVVREIEKWASASVKS